MPDSDEKNQGEGAKDHLPSFWIDEQQSPWDRVEDALGKDWLQTKSDLGLPTGVDLGQTAKMTLKEVAGVQIQTPSDLQWNVARQAIRLGYGAAAYWSAESRWTGFIEVKSEREWLGLDNGVAWLEARALVQQGWEKGRREIGNAVTLTRA